jgi:hypothetical protein
MNKWIYFFKCEIHCYVIKIDWNFIENVINIYNISTFVNFLLNYDIRHSGTGHPVHFPFDALYI